MRAGTFPRDVERLADADVDCDGAASTGTLERDLDDDDRSVFSERSCKDWESSADCDCEYASTRNQRPQDKANQLTILSKRDKKRSQCIVYHLFYHLFFQRRAACSLSAVGRERGYSHCTVSFLVTLHRLSLSSTTAGQVTLVDRLGCIWSI